MSSLNLKQLKYVLIFVLAVSVVLNILFYMRLSGACGKAGGDEKAPAVAPVPQAKPAGGNGDAPKGMETVPVETPAPAAADASDDSQIAPRQNKGLRFMSYYFGYHGESDGVNAEGNLRVWIDGLRAQKSKTEIKVSPALKGNTSAVLEYDAVSIDGTFEIGRNYTVTIPKGIRIHEDDVLEEDYLCVVKINPPGPSIEFATNGPYYQTKEENGVIVEWTMPIRHTNVNKVHVILWGLEEQNLDVSENLLGNYWSDYNNAFKKLMQRQAVATVELKNRKNVSMSSELNMAKLFPNLRPGVYGVALAIQEHMLDNTSFTEFPYTRMVILSDLAVSAVGECHVGTVAACVRRLSDGAAVADAGLTLVSHKRKVLAKGKSGADGTAILSFDNGIYENGDYAETLIARTDKDISFIRLDDTTHLSTSEFKNGDHTFNRVYYPFIYTERGIYRPGETVHASAFIRTRKDGKMCPASIPVEVKVSDSRGVYICKKTIKANANGFLTFEVPLSDAAPTGGYTVECRAGKHDYEVCHFQVGAFNPDRIKVSAKPEKEVYTLDEKPSIAFSAEYYFGGRVDDAKFTMAVSAEKTFPKHWGDYTVGNASERTWATDLGEFDVPNGNVQEGKMTLPSIGSRLNESTRCLSTVPLRVAVEVTATEAAAASVTRTATFTAMPHTALLGLKYDGGKGGNSHESDAEIEFRFLGLEKDKAVDFKKTDFSLKLQKLDWEYVMTNSHGSKSMEWKQVVKDVETLSHFELDKESATVTLPRLANGNYQLTATSKGGLETRLSFWHWSGSAGSVHSTNPYIITAKSDKESYLPGESVTLKFYAAMDGSCFAAAGEEKVEHTVAFDVKRGENTVAIPVPKDTLTSRYYVSLTVAGMVNGNLTRSFGLFNVDIDQNANRLGLKLNAPEKAEPKQKITVTLEADEAATAQIFAVDAGILSLTNYKTPDILDYFHGAYSSVLETHDIYSLLYPKLAIKDNDKVGGGDGGDGGMRRQILKEKKNAVVVLGAVDIPEKGAKSVEVELPDHTGAMRIMVVAAGATKVDSTDSTLVMRDKLSVLPSLPTAVAIGDKFQATFKLFNHEMDATDATLSITLPPELKADAKTEFTAKIEKGKSISCQIPLTAAKNGAFTVRHSMTLGGSTVTGESVVNVRPVLPFTTSARNVVLKPGETFEIAPDAAEWQSVNARELKVNANPASAIADALSWLNDYPYGCLEQTTSKAFPMLFVDSLVSAGVIDAGFKPQAEKKVNAASVALLSMLRGRRGFTGWIDSDMIWEEPGVYAAHFLFLAKSPVMSDTNISDIKSYMRTLLDLDKDNLGAYAFYVLSLMPMVDSTAQNLADKLLNGVAKENSIQRFLVGAALYNAGYAARGVPLVKATLDSAVWAADGKALPWMLSSKAARTAMVLNIAMDIVPDHPATVKMAMELASNIRNDSSCWGTTRENSLAAAALGKFAAHHRNGEIRMTIAEGDAPAEEYTSDNFTRKLAEDSKVVVKNTGKADIFLRLTTNGIPKKMDTEKDSVKVSKEILDGDGKPVTKVGHGDLLTVRITMTANEPLKNAVLLDLIPGGFAIEDGSLATRSNRPEAENKHKPYISRQEKLADRYLLFGVIPVRTSVITYRIRAVTPGTYAIPPARLEDMYEPDKCGTGVLDGSIVIE